jgi:hypothetical protein
MVEVKETENGGPHPRSVVPSRLSWGIWFKLFLDKCSYHPATFNHFAKFLF